MEKLEELHKQIGNCTVCSEFTELVKSQNLARGEEAKIMIIGIAPGNTEAKENLAFSGQAGKTLFNWLKSAEIGKDENEIRSQVYLTSIIKCSLLNFNQLRRMMRNCSHFLDSQLQLVKPSFVVTLGGLVFNKLFNNKLSIEEFVGNSYTSENFFQPDMFREESPFAEVKLIVPFPHPSGRSTWLQQKENKAKLDKAIKILKDNFNEVRN